MRINTKADGERTVTLQQVDKNMFIRLFSMLDTVTLVTTDDDSTVVFMGIVAQQYFKMFGEQIPGMAEGFHEHCMQAALRQAKDLSVAAVQDPNTPEEDEEEPVESDVDESLAMP